MSTFFYTLSISQTSQFSINVALVTIIATTLTLASVETITIPTSVHAQTSRPLGAPGSQLASLGDKWWQLILSTDITTQTDPFTVPFPCSQQTQGNTLFLVGQIFGTMRVNHGTCTISPQTSVLFPLINGVDIDCQSQNQNPTHAGVCTFGVKQNMTKPVMGQPFGPLRSLASVSGATGLFAFLDGVPLQYVSVQSPPGGFEVNLAAHDVFGFDVGPVTLHGVADGFYVLLPSLPIGPHSLSFGGCLPNVAGTLNCQTNIYTIVVR